MQKKIEKIERFLQKESKKRGFENVVFGLSGGIDSAVVGYVCNEVFKKNARAFIMPSSTSNPQNTKDAIAFAKEIGLCYEVIEIARFQDTFIDTAQLGGDSNAFHRIGNFTARIRMAILYDKSFLHHALVVGTSNKSELMLGYGTLYGDMACAINPIGDIYKSEIFVLAREMKIPSYITSKAPSADLFPGQSDEGDLGYSYKEIDRLLMAIERGLGKKRLLKGALIGHLWNLSKLGLKTIDLRPRCPK